MPLNTSRRLLTWMLSEVPFTGVVYKRVFHWCLSVCSPFVLDVNGIAVWVMQDFCLHLALNAIVVPLVPPPSDTHHHDHCRQDRAGHCVYE